MATVESAIPSVNAKQLATPRVFFLDIAAGRVLSVNPDGSDLKVLIAGGQKHPDGITIDPVKGHLYWTAMGNPTKNDGAIFRSDLDGGNITPIVPPGGTFTPKQLHIESKSQKIYWCDREGMRVMRCNLDGSSIETLVQTGQTEADRHDQTRWCVGIVVNPDEGKFYWTQKGAEKAGQGRIFRANIQMPAGKDALTRTDIELLFADLPEPIDLDLDAANKMLYWTDRGDPPRGNTANRASIDIKPNTHPQPQVLFNHLGEGIGMALDLKGGRMFVTDLSGSMYTASLDGSNKKMLMAAQGNLTGIAYAEAQP